MGNNTHGTLHQRLLGPVRDANRTRCHAMSCHATRMSTTNARKNGRRGTCAHAGSMRVNTDPQHRKDSTTLPSTLQSDRPTDTSHNDSLRVLE